MKKHYHFIVVGGGFFGVPDAATEAVVLQSAARERPDSVRGPTLAAALDAFAAFG